MIKKLAIQIPAYNEEASIGNALDDLPSRIKGVENIEVIVINDGSVDKTLEIVKQTGIKHIVNISENQGLGEAHRRGLAYALDIGADVIANFDADLQHRGRDLERLLGPLIVGKANAVIGDRQLKTIQGYPLYKLATQTFGSSLASFLFHERIKDVASGFRAYDRKAATVLARNLTNTYTYTLESLCIMARNNIQIVYVPIDVRNPTRETRLITSKMRYARNFFLTLIRCLIRY